MFLNVEKRCSEQMVSEAHTGGKTTSKPAEQKQQHKKASSHSVHRDIVAVLIKALTRVNRPLKKYGMFKKDCPPFPPGDPLQPNLL